jgi:hypothetical protein
VRWTLIGLLVVLILVGISACALVQHPVQPAPRDWQLPSDFAHCQKQEQVTWPDGRVTIVVSCPSGTTVFLDKRTKQVIDIDSLDFRK